jgi:hypothetical protein
VYIYIKRKRTFALKIGKCLIKNNRQSAFQGKVHRYFHKTGARFDFAAR